jgi:hypothetical protein
MSNLVLVYLLPMTAMVGCYLLLKHRTSTRNRRASGGIMPKRILEEIGIEFEVKYGTS